MGSTQPREAPLSIPRSAIGSSLGLHTLPSSVCPSQRRAVEKNGGVLAKDARSQTHTLPQRSAQSSEYAAPARDHKTARGRGARERGKEKQRGRGRGRDRKRERERKVERERDGQSTELTRNGHQYAHALRNYCANVSTRSDANTRKERDAWEHRYTPRAGKLSVNS